MNIPPRIGVDRPQKVQCLFPRHLPVVDVECPVFHIAPLTVQIILGNGFHGFYRGNKIRLFYFDLRSADMIRIDQGDSDCNEHEHDISSP